MKTATIQLFCPCSAFKKCLVHYEVAQSGKGYLYEILKVEEVISKTEWPVPQILQLNAHEDVDHMIAEKKQGEYSKEVLGVDMSKQRPKKITINKTKPKEEDEAELW